MSPERMQRSFIALFGDKQLGEVARGAFSKEEMSAIAKSCQLMKQNSEIPIRKGGEEREVVVKDGKDVRSVVDNNTAEVFAMASCAGSVLEDMVFHPERGILKDICIKHRTRPQIPRE